MATLGGFPGALAYVLGQEGGYVHHPLDRGGATNKGITQAVYSEYRRTLDLTNADVKDITDQEVEAIYRLRYWKRAGCDVIDAAGAHRLAFLHFDSAVQHGTERAVGFLQRSLGMPGVQVDGMFGPITMKAVFAAIQLDKYGCSPNGEDEVIDQYLLRRAVFYKRIVDLNPSQRVFQRGWAKRLNHIRAKVVTT